MLIELFYSRQDAAVKWGYEHLGMLMLSVDLKVVSNGVLLVCRGDVVGGREADYLFNLITRDDKGDVILDFGGVNRVDREGVSVISTGYEFLAHLGRRLFLKSPSADLVRALQERHLDAIFDFGQRSKAQASNSIQ